MINKLIIINKQDFPIFPLLMTEAQEKLKEGWGLEWVEMRGRIGGGEGAGEGISKKRKVVGEGEKEGEVVNDNPKKKKGECISESLA